MSSFVSVSRWFLERAALFAGLAAFGVFVLGVMPDAGPSADTEAYAHTAAFLVISFLFLAALHKHQWIGLAAAFALGLLIEAVQMLIPGRMASLSDVAANLVGVVAGAILFRLFVWLLAQRRAQERLTG